MNTYNITYNYYIYILIYFNFVCRHWMYTSHSEQNLVHISEGGLLREWTTGQPDVSSSAAGSAQNLLEELPEAYFLHFAVRCVPEDSLNLSRSLPGSKSTGSRKIIEIRMESNRSTYIYSAGFFVSSCVVFVSFISACPFRFLQFPGRFWRVSGSIPDWKPEFVPKGLRPIERFLLLNVFCVISGAILNKGLESSFPALFPCPCKPASRKRLKAPRSVIGGSRQSYWNPK